MSCIADRDEFLQQPNVAVFATVDSRGRPHGAPVWYLYEDGEFIVTTDRGSQKHRNVEANREVCLVIDKRTVPYYAVMVHGRAEVQPGVSEELRLGTAVRYLGEELGRAYVARTSVWEDSVTIRLRPRKVIEYHGRAR